MLLDNIRKSITRTFISSSASNIFFNQAPQNYSGSAYTTFYINDVTYRRRDTSGYQGDYKIQFNVFEKSYIPSASYHITDVILTKLDNGITITSASAIASTREYIMPTRKIDDVWQTTILYTIHII